MFFLNYLVGRYFMNTSLNTNIQSPQKTLYKWLLSGFCATVLPPAMAFDADTFKNFDVSIATGSTHSTASTSYVQSTPTVPGDDSEIDKNVVENVSNSTTYRAGIGYHFFAEELKDRNFLSDFLVQLNVYRNCAEIHGQVWGTGNPVMNNQDFKAPYSSTRLMLDFKPSVLTYANTSLYPIVGAGVAWNHMSYTQEDASGSDWPTMDSPTGTTKKIVYDFGVGISSQITDHLGASLEYLNTYLGNMTTSGYSTGSLPMYDQPYISIRSESFYLGFNWKF
jgi:opacity protein-like surface antigen